MQNYVAGTMAPVGEEAVTLAFVTSYWNVICRRLLRRKERG